MPRPYSSMQIWREKVCDLVTWTDIDSEAAQVDIQEGKRGLEAFSCAVCSIKQASFPGPRPASRCLQLGKLGGWGPGNKIGSACTTSMLCSGVEEPGNETSYIQGIETKVFTKQRDYSLFVSIFGWTLLHVFTFRLHNTRDEIPRLSPSVFALVVLCVTIVV